MQSADREVSSKPGLLVQLHFSNQACTFFAAGSQLDWPTFGVLTPTDLATHPSVLLQPVYCSSSAESQDRNSLTHSVLLSTCYTPAHTLSF